MQKTLKRDANEDQWQIVFCTLMPGEKIFRHSHGSRDERICILKGEMAFCSASTHLVLSAGMSVLCGKGIEHDLFNSSLNPCEFLEIRIFRDHPHKKRNWKEDCSFCDE